MPGSIVVELMRDGRVVFTDTKSTVHNFQPLMVQAGMVIDLIWDIALDSISAEFQKLIMPGVRGKKVMSIRHGQVTQKEG